MEMINVDELGYIEEDELGPSETWIRVGHLMAKYMNADMDVGKELCQIRYANNNWRKMHGLPTYHRNRPSMKQAEHWKLMKWEKIHREEWPC